MVISQQNLQTTNISKAEFGVLRARLFAGHLLVALENFALLYQESMPVMAYHASELYEKRMSVTGGCSAGE